MKFPAKDHPDDFYGLMIQTLIPRPVAWILSVNENGTHNVAPFSFFMGVTSEPPILAVSVGWKDDETRKDTWNNIERRSRFVVHIPPVSQADAVVATAAALPEGESELEKTGLQTAVVEGESLPRIKGPGAAFFCEKHDIIEVGEEKQGLILGEIKSLWVDDDLLSEVSGRIRIDPKRLDPLARLGMKDYAGLGGIFQIARPK